MMLDAIIGGVATLEAVALGETDSGGETSRGETASGKASGLRLNRWKALENRDLKIIGGLYRDLLFRKCRGI